MVFLGISLTMLQWSVLRLLAVFKLNKRIPPKETLKIILKQRKLNEEACDYPTNMMTGWRGVFQLHGARFPAEIYTRGCHWFPLLLA
jgi:hypothetical protein